MFVVFIIFTLCVKEDTILRDQMDQSNDIHIVVWRYEENYDVQEILLVGLFLIEPATEI